MKSKVEFYTEGEKMLLHGVLHIKIIRCSDLPAADGVCAARALGSWLPEFAKSNSDPFVTVNADETRIAKTRCITANLNPIFDETFYSQMAHYCTGLTFNVYDLDIPKDTDFLGKTFLPVQDLVKFDEDGHPLRVGEHRIARLEGQGSDDSGTIEYFVQYIPVNLMKLQPKVPGVYFKCHENNECKLYVNADDGETMAPAVKYGGQEDHQRVWKPPRLWRDIYDAICDARHFIYITGWSVDCTQSLLRGRERKEAEEHGQYNPVLGELLKQKANEGVRVNMLVWDDATSDPDICRPVGFMGTHDEQSREFFQDSNVNFRLAPMRGDESQFIREQITKYVMFTHHQKICVVDSKVKDGRPGEREPLAFVGGIDLTNGRWDNIKHPLFRTLNTDHLGDAHNGCFAVNTQNVGPREPWHDIHSCVRGPAAYDVIANFTERWRKQAGEDVQELLLDLSDFGMGQPRKHESRESWCTQVVRSIDERTCDFDSSKVANFLEDDIKHLPGVHYMGDHIDDNERGQEKRRHFTSKDASRFDFIRGLALKKGRYIDCSMHEGWVHHIRRAQHSIYIESQYFLGSSHMWLESQGTKCGNLIPAEIMLKIIEKIENGERFAAYILVPMWPEGISDSGSVQAILHWQRLTMEGMYKRIAQALKKAGRNSETPKDYLNFYCLANRETEAGSTAMEGPQEGTVEETLSQTRRHLIYVHSKMLIVDDAVTIIGSANINQRSMDGARDSEIGLACYQPSYMPTEHSVPHGDVHGYRMHCWATITNTMEECFREPSSLRCVRRFNQIAERNWEKYISPEVTEMHSHVIPFPVEIDYEGNVFAHHALDNGNFPDTDAKVLGALSGMLPEILTT